MSRLSQFFLLALLLLGSILSASTAHAADSWSTGPVQTATPSLGVGSAAAQRAGPVFGPRPTAADLSSPEWNRKNGIIWTALGGSLVLSSAWVLFYVPYRAAALAGGNAWLATAAATAVEFVLITAAFGTALVFGILFLIQGVRYLKEYDRLQGGRVGEGATPEPASGEPVGLGPALLSAQTTPLWSF